ncbi:hypothetical protein [Serpentinicella alkaliphila]|uniref:Uncharacterized protein n=1 Tax=Serpentinicella alkaliphila TaxID=1734049 RepID=A0A4R2TLS8_9FIRM|nr:hypothetical protein [Serpentinicella alkaliphila]QUH24564.1 hypothetical protein HZR23_01300 [Serpentinicella alkaliphila]TCQ04660.1 hypothetical protein EDD79_100664 [Serpentinicella alkaliphila]
MDKYDKLFRVIIPILYLLSIGLSYYLHWKTFKMYKDWEKELREKVESDYEKLKQEGRDLYYLNLTYSELNKEYVSLIEERDSYNLGFSKFSKKEKKMYRKYLDEKETRIYEKADIMIVSPIEAEIRLIEEIVR